MIRAVTFDYWDTLVAERLGHMRQLQMSGFADVLAAAGHEVSGEALADAFRANWTEFERRWTSNEGQHTPADSASFICRALRIEPDGIRDDLTDAFRLAGERATLEAAPGIDACLRTLRDAGVRLGIVCDVGLTSSPTLRLRLEDFGLLDAFGAWAFSDETGWFKPAAQAFWPALERLAVSPAEVLHVGDSLRTDVAGARELGMTSVRYRGFSDRADGALPEADHVIDDHRDLPGILGIG